MPGNKRPTARITGAARARDVMSMLGRGVAASRTRRGLIQRALAEKVGISRARLAAIEAGQGGAAPAEVWFALAATLGRYLRFEFARDPVEGLADAGHLDIQELLLRDSAGGGWEQVFEARSRAFVSVAAWMSGLRIGECVAWWLRSAGTRSATSERR